MLCCCAPPYCARRHLSSTDTAARRCDERFFITGTDTGVGKTYVDRPPPPRPPRARGLDAVGFKPLCCGSREDAEILRDAAARWRTQSQRGQPGLVPRTRRRRTPRAMVENRSRRPVALIRETLRRLCAQRHRGPSWSKASAAGSCRSCSDYADRRPRRSTGGLPVVVVVAQPPRRAQPRRAHRSTAVSARPAKRMRRSDPQ